MVIFVLETHDNLGVLANKQPEICATVKKEGN